MVSEMSRTMILFSASRSTTVYLVIVLTCESQLSVPHESSPQKSDDTSYTRTPSRDVLVSARSQVSVFLRSETAGA